MGCVLSVAAGATAMVVGGHLVRTVPTVARKVHAPIPVRIAVAKQVDMLETLGASGTIQPIALVNLTAKTTARVERLGVDLGDLVTPGQTLIELNRELAHAALKTAQAAREQAAGELHRANQHVLRLKAIYAQGLSHAMIQAAQTAREQAAGELQRAELHVQRIHAIYTQKLLSQSELEKAQAAVDEARARLSEAEEKLWRAKKDVQSELEKAQAVAEEAKARLSETEEKLLRAKKEVEQATLVSPVSGIVMERLVNVGETPQTEQKLLTIGQIDHVVVETKLAEERVGDVYLQQLATVTVGAFPNETFTGKVVKIKPVADPETKTFLVYVRVANPQLQLKPGLTGFVRLQKDHRALGVPSIAILNPTGNRDSAVFVVDDTAQARLKKVRVGVAADGMTAVLDGLAAGERVVVVGQFNLRDGDQVRIGEEFDELKPKVVKHQQPQSATVVVQ
jgi:RND family efflux transporter MFP subunit